MPKVESQFQLNRGQFLVYDEGWYYGTGTCTGGYVDCNCNNHPLGYRAPSYSLSTYPEQYTYYAWWFVVTNYLERELITCDSGNCQYTGYAGETDSTWVDENAGWDDEPYQPCSD